MKGIVFTEFIEMVEADFGLEVTDRILDHPALGTGGVYTSVGTYDPAELITLVGALSAETGKPVPELVRAFGVYMFPGLVQSQPAFVEGFDDPLQFLTTVHDTIHVEVIKLYPDAELPSFDCSWGEPGELIMVYRSPRKLEEFAHGLIEGCGKWFGIELTIERTNDAEASVTDFRIRRAVSKVA